MFQRQGTWKQSVIITATLAFFAASVFCCCLGLISPKEVKAAEVKSCHAHKTQKDQPAPATNKDCNYCPHKTQFLTLEKTTLDSPSFSIFAFLQGTLSISLHNSFGNFDNHFTFSQGPPGKLVSTVPLYLQHSVLRL